MPEPSSIPTWLEILFTYPDAPQSANFEGGPDEALAAAIDKARLSVEMAANSLNLGSIRDALLHAHQRGVVVRMVMESDNMGNQEVQQILEAGIPITGDQPEGLMLNNFVVIDRYEVWTGSMNFTVEGAYSDNNNLLRIRSKVIAEDYLVEFNGMFDITLSDPDAGTATPNPAVSMEGTNLEVSFLPEDALAARIKELVMGATQSINYLSPEFFGAELGGAIAEVGQQVKVVGVVDGSMAEFGVPVPGSDVRADGNKNGSMHESVMIIDQKIVIIGAYNFTSEANEAIHGTNSSLNHSNVMILFNPEVATVFASEFRRIYIHAQVKWPSPSLSSTPLPGETSPPPGETIPPPGEIPPPPVP
jgi:phosphatidylserine/phosphatidylglycerophosphate/cardiolipin synthase-like enzyme